MVSAIRDVIVMPVLSPSLRALHARLHYHRALDYTEKTRNCNYVDELLLITVELQLHAKFVHDL